MMLFEDQDYLKDTYQNRGNEDVLKHIARELEEIESLVYTVQGSLENENIASNEKIVAKVAANQAYELRMKIEILLEALPALAEKEGEE